MPTPAGSHVVRDVDSIPAGGFWDTVAQAFGFVYGDIGRGEMYNAPAPITPGSSNGYVANDVVKGSAGIFIGAFGQYKGAVTAWVMLFDAISAPATNTAPLAAACVPAIVAGVDVNWNIIADRPWIMSNGIYIALSSTGGLFTASANTDITITWEMV